MTLKATATRAPTRTLLIASDLELAKHVQRLLLDIGCQVVETVGDGIEAQKRCERLAPQLVLIDEALHGTQNAWQVASALSARVHGPMIFLCDPKTTPPEAAFVHGLGFVDKPVARPALGRAINLALYRYPLEMGRARGPARGAAKPAPIEPSEPDRSASNRLTAELLGSMAHELRAPLQGVMGFATFLRDGKAGSVTETQQQYLDHIGSGANHALQVVNDVLDMTATDSDALHVRTEPVDPERAASEVMQVLQVLAFRRRVAVEIQNDEQLGHVVSDATKIKQVLYNLVSNALKFTAAGGRVTVNVRRDGPDAFCIEVADTGVGIPEDQLDALFERAADAQLPGNGLGLFLTKRVVDALGGTVTAHNRPEGGSVFAARLPIAPSVADPRTRDILLPDDP